MLFPTLLNERKRDAITGSLRNALLYFPARFISNCPNTGIRLIVNMEIGAHVFEKVLIEQRAILIKTKKQDSEHRTFSTPQ